MFGKVYSASMKGRHPKNTLNVFLEKQIVAAKIRDLKPKEKNNIVKSFVFNYLKSMKQEDLKRLYKYYYEKDGSPKLLQPPRNSRWSRLIDRIHA